MRSIRARSSSLHGMSDYSTPSTAGEWWRARASPLTPYDQRGFGKAPNAGIWRAPRRCAKIWPTCAEAVANAIPTSRFLRWARAWRSSSSCRPGDAKRRAWMASSWSRPQCGRKTTCRFSIARAVALAHTFALDDGFRQRAEDLAVDNIECCVSCRAIRCSRSGQDRRSVGLVNLMGAARKAPEHLDAPPPIPLSLWRQGSDIRAATEARRQGAGPTRRVKEIRAAITCCCASRRPSIGRSGGVDRAAPR